MRKPDPHKVTDIWDAIYGGDPRNPANRAKIARQFINTHIALIHERFEDERAALTALARAMGQSPQARTEEVLKRINALDMIEKCIHAQIENLKQSMNSVTDNAVLENLENEILEILRSVNQQLKHSPPEP